jgi:hypothetical protein
MEWSRWLFDPWSNWGVAFIAFSIGCMILGNVSRPLVTVTSSGAAAALLTITTPLPVGPALALLVVPLSGACWVAIFRAGKIKSDVFLASVLLPFSGLLSVFVEHWLPSVVAGGAAVGVSRLAPKMSLGAVFVIGVLPTLVELLALLLTPQVLGYRLPSELAQSSSPIVGAVVTVGVAILGSMVWVEWREQRGSRRDQRP